EEQADSGRHRTQRGGTPERDGAGRCSGSLARGNASRARGRRSPPRPRLRVQAARRTAPHGAVHQLRLERRHSDHRGPLGISIFLYEDGGAKSEASSAFCSTFVATIAISSPSSPCTI